MSAPQQQQQPDRRPLSARLGIKLELLQPSSQESEGEGGSRPLTGGYTADRSTVGSAASSSVAAAAGAGGAGAASSTAAVGGGGGGGGAGGQQHHHHGHHHGHGHGHHHRRGGPGTGHSQLDEAAAEAASRQVGWWVGLGYLGGWVRTEAGQDKSWAPTPTDHIFMVYIQVVERLRAAGVNLLALDFDMTVLDIHTGGRWTGKAQVRAFGFGGLGCMHVCMYVRPAGWRVSLFTYTHTFVQ